MTRTEVKSAAMKEMVALLNAFDDHDKNDVALFQQLMGQILEEALPELSDRLIRPSTSWGLKRLILASPAHFRHPEWTPILLRALMHETDGELFEEGCRALVQIGGMAETDALRQIAWQRQEPALQAIVSRKLAWLEPRQPFSYHFRDLLLGSQNARLSDQAALHLASVARLNHLADLATACDHPDNMVSLHAIKVISAIQRPEAGRFLMKRFDDMCDALLLDNWFRSAQEQIKRATPQSVKGVILELLRSCPGSEPHATALAEIGKALDDPAVDSLPLVQRLRTNIQGLQETRLVDCLADLAIGHSVRHGNLVPEPPEELRQRTQRLQGNLDACAEGLAMFTRRGILEKEDVLPLFQKAYEGGAGGDGFGGSFAEILENEDAAQLDLILAASNHRWREEGIRTLGERKSTALLPFFLKATADPIVDNAQLAIQYLGKLPGAFAAALDLFRSGKADQIELALNIFSLNGMTEAGPVLVAYLKHVEREDLLIGVIRCLGALRFQPAIVPLLDLMRGGQSPRLLKAVAESLIAFGNPEAARGFLLRAQDVKNPEIQLLAIEGIAQVRPSFFHGLSRDEDLLAGQLLESCFEEGIGFRFRAVSALQGLWTVDDAWYERFENHLGKWTAEQKKRPTWDREQQQIIAGAARELERKRRELGELEASGNRVRERIMAYVPGDAKALQALIAALDEPGVFIGLNVRTELEALIGSEFDRPGINEKALEGLCRLSGKVRAVEFRRPLLDLLQRTGARSSLHKASLDALTQLGCPEERLKERQPLQSVLILDPSSFFRKRLVGVLQGCSVQEAQDRAEAEAILTEGPVDLLISEASDQTGDLQDWFATMWRARKVRQVVLSTASRALSEQPDKPWLAGALLKPYPMEELLALLEG